MEQLLQTHAEVAIALTGFASVVAALRRPLTPLARQRFLSLLALSVIQIFGCLLPLWFIQQLGAGDFGWRVLSAVLLLNLMRMRWLVLLPSRELGAAAVQAILSPLVSRTVWATGLLGYLLFLLNIVGMPLQSGFDLYYAGLFSTLLVGFALFADVAVADS